jgi:hypothetical protein
MNVAVGNFRIRPKKSVTAVHDLYICTSIALQSDKLSGQWFLKSRSHVIKIVVFSMQMSCRKYLEEYLLSFFCVSQSLSYLSFSLLGLDSLELLSISLFLIFTRRTKPLISFNMKDDCDACCCCIDVIPWNFCKGRQLSNNKRHRNHYFYHVIIT